jgi:hypothetical protein
MSVIRWVAEPVKNAIGPNFHDARSGEILSAHILIWADVLNLIERMYFAQVGPTDPRVTKLPLPPEVVGEVLRYVVTHEVGHTLGLRHNFKASQAFTVAQLRDPAFVKAHGPVASVMSYGRLNYVAQPGDGIADFTAKMSDYDRFAISWGYRPIPEAKSPADEVPILDVWASVQLENPWLQMGGEDAPSYFDPTVLTENIGSERIPATLIGLQGLDQRLSVLREATTTPGGNYARMRSMYLWLLDTRTHWLDDVAKMVGGMIEHRTHAGYGDAQFVPVPPDQQRQAARFVIKMGLTPPQAFLDPDLLSRFAFADATRPVEQAQAKTLASLLNGRVFTMLHQQAVLKPEGSYAIVDLLIDISEGAWTELWTPGAAISPLRRSMQRAFLNRLAEELQLQNEPINFQRYYAQYGVPPAIAAILFSGGQGTDFNAAVQQVCKLLAEQIESAIGWAEDAPTRAHLGDSLLRIRQILALAG